MTRQPEAQIQHDIRLALSAVPGLVLWRNHVGAAMIDGRKQSFGLARGSADLIGIWQNGAFVALEVKTPSGRVSEAQARFLSLVRSHGGIAVVVRSVEEALAVFA